MILECKQTLMSELDALLVALWLIIAHCTGSIFLIDAMRNLCCCIEGQG